MKLFIVAVVLVICGSLVAGCGGSRRLSLAAERAAIASAQRQNDNLRIFPTSPGTKTCKLPPSGRLQAASTEVSEQTALTVGVVLTIMVLWSCASRVCRSRSTR